MGGPKKWSQNGHVWWGRQWFGVSHTTHSVIIGPFGTFFWAPQGHSWDPFLNHQQWLAGVSPLFRKMDKEGGIIHPQPGRNMWPTDFRYRIKPVWNPDVTRGNQWGVHNNHNETKTLNTSPHSLPTYQFLPWCIATPKTNIPVVPHKAAVEVSKIGNL